MNIKTFSIKPLPPTHKCTCGFIEIILQVFPLRCSNRSPKGGQEKKKERIWQKHFDSGWLYVTQITPWMGNLTSNNLNLIWRSFPELSFGVRWVSIHWAVMEIEPLKICLKSTWIAIEYTIVGYVNNDSGVTVLLFISIITDSTKISLLISSIVQNNINVVIWNMSTNNILSWCV